MVVSPLAGIAFVAAAAAVAISPVYLTLTSSILSGRKKRDLSSMINPSMADKITPEMMQKIQELQVPPVTLDCHSAIWTISNHLGGMSSHSLCAFFVGRWSLCIDPGEISGFHSERDWLPTTDYVHVSILLRLHAGRQRLPRSYFLRVRQCQFKHFRWGTRRLIHVGYTFRILI